MLQDVNLIFPLLLTALAVTCGLREGAQVTLSNNGYEGLLIAISDSVPASPELIPRIQQYFEEMSALLFAATKRRAYLRDIIILVPKSWPENSTYGQAGIEAFDKANVIIDKPSGLEGNNPYVKQKGECGQPGTFMHLTPAFVLDDAVARQYGSSPAKTVLHEWGHLRWGLFDEYPVDENDAHFYHDSISGEIESVRCSRGVMGRGYKIVNDNIIWSCSLDKNTSLPERNCRFAPSVSANEGTASLMSYHFVNSVIEFCDNDEQAHALDLHNDQAPNRQNRLCGGRSAWEVMREHEDFRNNNNPPVQGYIDTTPTFKVVQQQLKRYVLVLDVSGSMASNNKLVNLKKACVGFLQTTVDEGSQVGIVTFNSVAATLKRLTTVNSEAVRNQLTTLVYGLVANGGTCIGCGLHRGIQLLEKNNNVAAGGILIVVSDGKENTGSSPNVATMKPILLEKKVIVDALLFTDLAEDQLISLAKDTGGLSFFDTGNTLSTALTDALSKAVTQRTSGLRKNLVQVLSDTITVSSRNAFQGSVYVDSTVGNNTRFTFTWSTGLISVTLRAPDNVTITPTAQDYGSGVLSLNIEGTAKVGKWLYTVTSSGSENAAVQVQVSSRPSSDAAPIVLSASVSSDTVDIADPSMSRIAIYGEVSQGYTPVVGATVVAYVDTSTGNTHTLQLLDNGAGADNAKNDGIYTAYFLNFGGNVKHSVQVAVKGEEGASVKSAGTSSNGIKSNITFKPVEPFERSDSGGLFTVRNLPASTPGSEPPDLYPPGRIYDLALVAVNTEDKTVTLSWTATGDDLDQGNASSYIIRYSSSISKLRLNFNNTNKLLERDLVQGKLDSPLPAGETETFVIRFNQANDLNIMYFIALLATDDKNQTGERSNIVSVSFIYSNPFPSPNIATSTEATTERITIRTELKTPAVATTTSLMTEMMTEKSATEALAPESTLIGLIGYIVAGVAVLVSLILSCIIVALGLHIRKKSRSHGENQAKWRDNHGFNDTGV